jgi:hypothetical protein
MADDDAMSEGMAGLGLAGDGGAAEPDVSDTPVEVPPVNTHTAANPNADGIAAGSLGVGESIPTPFAVPAVYRIAPTAREAITSGGARIAASAARILHGDVVMHDGSAPMPVRHEFNRNWLSLAIAYIKDRKYDGLSSVPHNHDHKSRFQFFRYHVGASIRVCQGPRHDQESIDMVESQCAILLYSDKKYDEVSL